MFLNENQIVPMVNEAFQIGDKDAAFKVGEFLCIQGSGAFEELLFCIAADMACESKSFYEVSNEYVKEIRRRTEKDVHEWGTTRDIRNQRIDARIKAKVK